MRSPSVTIAALAALAACGPAAPKAERAEPREVAPAEAAPADATEAPVPDEAVSLPVPAQADQDASLRPATVPAGTPPPDGCIFTAAPGVTDPAGISILGLGEGGGGYDMPDICPAQACSAGLTIDLPKRDDWTPGVYDVVVATDRGTLRCQRAVKPPPRWSMPAHCHRVRELTAECAGPGSFAAGPIMISGTPAVVRVSIALDGKPLADQVLEPWFSAKRWDGWDCDGSCRSAKASVTVR